MEKFEDLLGKTLLNIENRDNEALIFTLDDGERYQLYHDQECCEAVRIEEVIGELKDLIGAPIMLAEEIMHEDINPDGVKIPKDQESFTWTFYKLATMKGYVTIRWYGESSGYYSEDVEWEKIPNNREEN